MKTDVIGVLKTRKIITDDDIKAAETEAQKTGLTLEKALEKLGIIKAVDIAYVMSEEMGTLFIDLKEYILDANVVKLVPEAIAKQFSAIPVFRSDSTLTVAMVNPNDLVAIDLIRNKSGCANVDIVLASSDAVLRAIDQYYAGVGKVQDVVKTIETKEPETKEVDLGDTTGVTTEEAPIVKVVNLIVTEAVRSRASDIHIEPDENTLRIRYRIDGVLHEVNTIPTRLTSAILSRIKILSKMNIAEKRKPQDGKIELKLENKSLDLRVSSCPTVHGENVVIRILDKSSVLLGLGDLGFMSDDLKRFNKVINRSHGIVLVTGPTGSGKTSTLYASLATINSIEKNIITIEDPVEYQIPLIRQTQVNPKIGFNFAEGLRTFLRQDPDIIMVGEIRDKETAEIAIQASLTGHLVFSTLHTNDACSTVTRLIEMGIEPFLIAGTLAGILAQRLVRVSCERCKEKHVPQDEVLKDLKIPSEVTLYKGAGCPKCNYSGFSGRTGVYELLVINETVKHVMVENPTLEAITKAAKESGFMTLIQDGVEKVKKGITTPEEILRVMQSV